MRHFYLFFLPLFLFFSSLQQHINTQVLCQCDTWRAGVIIATHYRQPDWADDVPDAPYQVVEGGREGGKESGREGEKGGREERQQQRKGEGKGGERRMGSC